jgi:hypothetical protein
MSKMVAKFKVREVIPSGEPVTGETLKMSPVTSKPFDAEGASEDNSFAKWTPSGSLEMFVQNPALIGTIKAGDTFLITFDKVD